MSRWKNAINKELPPVVLYLDDLTAIISILTENWFENIEIQTDKGSYTKEQLSKIKPDEQLRIIRCWEPVYFIISFDNSHWSWGTTIYMSDQDSFYSKIYQSVLKILYSRKRTIFFLFTRPWVSAIFFLITFLIFIANYKTINFNTPLWTVWIVWIVLNVILLVGACVIPITRLVQNNIFYYKNRDGISAFLLKNQNQILTDLVIALVTFILTKFFW